MSEHDKRPVTDDSRITYFAATHTRGKREMFGIRAIDRGKHMYVIGKTGMGKSTMLENMAIQDIQNGEGLAFIDPHGSTAEKLLDFVPHERINDVLYFAPFDVDYPVGFNVMEDVGYDKRHLVVSGLMGALKRIWVDAWSARMEYILQNTLLALLEYPDTTLLDVNRMLTNKAFRAAVVEKIQDPVVKAFWTEEFANFTDSYTREATPAIQNKIGQFVSNPLIRNIIGQPKSSFDVREMMDNRKILIVNLSKGRMGETNASLLGSMLVVKIYLAAMSRADEPAVRMAKLPRYYFYVDEFQSMMNEAFADILSESRKYKLALTLANQYIEQMEEKVRDAVFGNIGTMVCFRVGPFDAEVLKTVFEPTFMAEDLVGLGLGQIYLTLMIDGVGSPPFSAETIPPIEAPAISYRDDAVLFSRQRYARTREDIERSIAERQQEFAVPPRQEKRREFRPGGGGDYQRRVPEPQLFQQAVARAAVSPPTPPPAPPPVRVPEMPAPLAAVEHRPYMPPSGSKSPFSPRPQRQESHAQPRDERALLRDAIQSAQTVSTAQAVHPTPEPMRSPADILRMRREKESSGRGVQHAPHMHGTPRPQPPTPFPSRKPDPIVPSSMSPSAAPQVQQSQSPAPTPRPPQPDQGEVSPEALRRLLQHEERTP